MRINNQYTRFKVFMFTYWAMMLSTVGMYTMYMLQNGFSKAEVSITVTIFTIATLLGQNFFGYLADRFSRVKRILCICTGLGIVTAVALGFVHAHGWIILLIVLFGFLLYGTVPLSEAWYIAALRSNGHQNEFGKIRGLGSIGYAVSGVLLGILLESFGWRIYSGYIAGSLGILLAVLLFMQESGGVAFYKGTGDLSFAEAFREIARIKPLRFVIVILFVYTFAVKGIYNYLGFLVSDSGGGPLSLGFTYFFDACPEVVTFFLAPRLLGKYRSKDLIFVAFLLQILRLVLILVFNSALAIILLGPLSGFAYGLLAAAYKTYIYELAPEKYKISCLSFSESLIGLSAVFSAPVFGLVIMQFGGQVSVALALALVLSIMLLVAGSLLRERRMYGSSPGFLDGQEK